MLARPTECCYAKVPVLLGILDLLMVEVTQRGSSNLRQNDTILEKWSRPVDRCVTRLGRHLLIRRAVR